MHCRINSSSDKGEKVFLHNNWELLILKPETISNPAQLLSSEVEHLWTKTVVPGSAALVLENSSDSLHSFKFDETADADEFDFWYRCKFFWKQKLHKQL